MKIFWQDQAVDDLEDTLAYVAEDSPEAAIRLVDDIFSSIERNLTENPRLGRPGRVDGTREFIAHKNYIAVYRLTNSQIDILSIRHAARFWPDAF